MDVTKIPWNDVAIGMTVLLVTTGFVILCRFLLRKLRTWRIQRFLRHRSELAPPNAKNLTQHDKQILRKKAQQSRVERFKKSFALQGNADFYIGWGIFIVLSILLVLLALRSGFHKY